ncbi:MAG: prephenate dehydrogenase/arogenate dehydrogenase family protein [Acidimicrobiia bacterium]
MRRIALAGTGLIGGSIGLALRRAGVEVRAFDRDAERAAHAKQIGAVDEVAATLIDAVDGAEAMVVAVPVGAIAPIVVEALDAGVPAATDVGSVKAPVVAEVERLRPDLAPRFVGGHPMAGSEQDGLDGADDDLFVGSTWVLTPTERTAPPAFGVVRTLVAALGAEIVAVSPAHHDALVAVVSHVPQLAATTLMDVAATSGEQHATLLRLAAGGFRDMTRIAAGHPGIWPDICVANRDAIVAALDEYVEALERVRDLVVASDRPGLLDVLERARAARRSLPVGTATGEGLVELRVPVPDHPGVLSDVTTLAGRRGINIADLEIAHSMEGGGGVLVLVVNESADIDGFEAALGERGYHCSRTALP